MKTGVSTRLTWALLSAPAAYLLAMYWLGKHTYGEFIHYSGQLSIWLLLLALAISPLRRFAGSAGWLIALARQRRGIGVASFGYALLHTLAYVEYKWGAGLIMLEAMRPGLASAWLALLLMLVLALSSNDYSVRRLGRRWKTLHQSVYLAAALSFLHWFLSSIDLWSAALALGILLILVLARWYGRPSPP